MLVRFIAVGLIGLSLLELGLYGAECFLHHQIPRVMHGAFLFIPFMLGLIVLARAKAVAEWISNRFD